MKKNLLYIILATFSLLISAGCRKDEFDGQAASDGKGKTIIKFINHDSEAPISGIWKPSFTDVQEITLFEITRSVHSKASLNSTLTMNLDFDQTALDDYAADFLTTIDRLPDAAFILDAPAFVKNGTGYKVTFKPGETVVGFKIRLDGSALDWTKLHGFAFTISGISGDGEITLDEYASSILPTIGPSSDFEGDYDISAGEIMRYTAGVPNVGDDLNGSLSGTLSLATKGVGVLEISGLTWANGGGIGGIDHLRISVNSQTNAVNVFSLGNTSLVNAPGEINEYDPLTKTFTLNFLWSPTGNKREVIGLVFKLKEED